MYIRKNMDIEARKAGYRGIKDYLKSEKYHDKIVSACDKHQRCQICKRGASIEAYLNDISSMSIASRGYENMTAVCINCNSKILYDKNGTQRNVPEMFSMLQKLLGNNPSYEDRPAGRGERRKSSDPANCRMTKEIVKEIASEMFKGCKYAKTKHLNYRQRDKALAMHGYLNYQTYMQSAVWVDKRNRVLRMFDKQCEICKSPACCVHHRWYTIENLFGTSTNGMVAICEYCHTSIEIDENGNKIFNPKLVDANFRQRLEEHQGKLAN